MAALLFKIQWVNEMRNLNDTPSVTDLQCRWAQPRSHAKDSLGPLIDSMQIFNVAELGVEKERDYFSEQKRQYIYNSPVGVSEEDTDAFLKTVMSVEPNALCLSLQSPVNVSKAREIRTVLECGQAAIAKTTADGSSPSLVLWVPAFLAEVRAEFTSENSALIEEVTRDQSDQPLWHRFRKHRISASRCHEYFTVSKKGSKEISNALWRKFSGFSDISDVAPVRWGRIKENVARQAFLSEMERTHDDAQILRTGLFISTENPVLAASPDGIFKCSCHEEALIEIKCPWSARDGSIRKKEVILPYLDGSLKLKQSHSYHDQVLMQMGVAKFKKCYFVVWCPKDGVLIQEIDKSEQDWMDLETSLVRFYEDVITKELIKECVP